MNDTISKIKAESRQLQQKVTWENIGTSLYTFAESIKNLGYESLYGIPRGGSVVAVMLSHLLDLPLVGLDAIIEKTLIVDDICDKGTTLKSIQDEYPSADTYTIYTKTNPIVKPTYHSTRICDSVWLVFPWEEQKPNMPTYEHPKGFSPP